MAELVITFSKIDSSEGFDAPLARGSDCRTEVVTMPDTGTLVAAGEQAVELLADADCWVAIGPEPDPNLATDGTGVTRKLKAGLPYCYGLRDGDKVAVVAAA
jgi:hypothetical protein